MSQTSPIYSQQQLDRGLRFGLVGCGRAAERIYLPALERVDRARLAAAVDPRKERRDLIANMVPGCRSFDSAGALFADGSLRRNIIDAVIITTPPESHVAIIKLALEAGLPVLVEKPLAPTAEDLPALARLAADRGLPVMVGFNRRYWIPVRRLRERLQQAPSLNNVRANLLFISGQGAWNPIETVGGPLEDLGSHQLDLLAYLFDSEIRNISARWDEDGGPASGINMLVELACGASAECRAARVGSTAEWIRIRKASSERNGQYYIHTGSEQFYPAGGPVRFLMDVGDALGRRVLGRRSSLRSSYDRQLEEFMARVQAHILGEAWSSAGIGAGIAAGIAAAEAVDAARRSANQGGTEEAIFTLDKDV